MSDKMLTSENFLVTVCDASHTPYATVIVEEMAVSALQRGTGIAKRSPEYLQEKMKEGKAVIALSPTGEWAGFCYIEAWGHDQFVANSGLIVSPRYRQYGLAARIKARIFQLSRERYPDAKIFGLTTSLAVMKINSKLGYEPVVYDALTDDEQFWAGCQNCVNFEILQAKGRKNCLCTAMLYDPADHAEEAKPQANAATRKKKKRMLRDFSTNIKLYARWMRLKQHVFLREQSKRKPQPNKA